MFYTLAGAAKASGLAEAVIVAAIERGEITGSKDLFGEWQVDDIEIPRLFFPIGNGRSSRDAARAPTPAIPAIEAETSITETAPGNGDLSTGNCAACPAGDAQGEGGNADAAGAGACSGEGAQSSSTQPNSAPPALWECVAPSGQMSLRPPAHQVELLLPRLDEAGAILIETRPSWERDIKVDKDDRGDLFTSAAADRRRTILFAGALLGAVAVGWIGGFASYHLFGRSVISVADQKRAPSTLIGESRSAALGKPGAEASGGVATTGKISPSGTESATGRRYRAAGKAASPSKAPLPLAQQNSVELLPDNSSEPVLEGVRRGADEMARRVPAPETRPTSIPGWTVRNVYNGTAVLEGPDGVWRVARGDTVPALGRVDSIVLWGSRWIVATSRGLITTP